MAFYGERRALFKRLIEHVPSSTSWFTWLTDQLEQSRIDVGVHVAVFVQPYLSAILEGRKTVESRFSINRCAPYCRIDEDDVIVLKQSGGPAVGVAKAGKISFFQLSPSVMASLRREFSDKLYALDDEFWKTRAHKRFATLIELQQVMTISPMRIGKQDRRGWVAYASAHPLWEA